MQISLRLPALKQAFSYSSTTSIYEAISNGLLPKPIKLGQRTSAWPADEVELVLTARAGGASEIQLRQLVDRIHSKRSERWAALQADLGVTA